jgi:casein kinase II subunit beta
MLDQFGALDDRSPSEINDRYFLLNHQIELIFHAKSPERSHCENRLGGFHDMNDCLLRIYLAALRMFLFSEIVSRARKAQTGQIQNHQSFDVSSDSYWVRDFVSRNQWLCVVASEYVADNFNLYGLSNVIADYTDALKVVRGQITRSSEISEDLQQQAEVLYGLIHSRYIITFTGVRNMKSRYDKQLFGTCPRVACGNQALLPIGLKPDPGEMRVKAFCPSCQDIYDSDSQLDGSCFGPYFPHFFLQAMKGDLKIEPRVPTQLAIFGVPIDSASTMSRTSVIQ